MTQKELIDKVHDEMYGRVPFAAVVRRISKVIAQEGETNFRTMFARLDRHRARMSTPIRKTSQTVLGISN